MPETPYRTEYGIGWIIRDDAGSLTGIELPGGDRRSGSSPAGDALVEPMEQYFAGNASLLTSDELIAAASNTQLQRSIYEVVSGIRPGHTMTYSAVAAAVGRPRAARAVGAAMARNPFPPIIPCHRVVAADGSMAGYAGGIEMKEGMLDMENDG